MSDAPHAPAFAPGEPVAERLTAIVTALVTELAVLRERLDTVERLLAGAGTVPPGAIEDYAPDAAAEAARAAWRQRYLERIFADLTAEADRAARGAPDAG